MEDRHVCEKWFLFFYLWNSDDEDIYKAALTIYLHSSKELKVDSFFGWQIRAQGQGVQWYQEVAFGRSSLL